MSDLVFTQTVKEVADFSKEFRAFSPSGQSSARALGKSYYVLLNTQRNDRNPFSININPAHCAKPRFSDEAASLHDLNADGARFVSFNRLVANNNMALFARKFSDRSKIAGSSTVTEELFRFLVNKLKLVYIKDCSIDISLKRSAIEFHLFLPRDLYVTVMSNREMHASGFVHFTIWHKEDLLMATDMLIDDFTLTIRNIQKRLSAI